MKIVEIKRYAWVVVEVWGLKLEIGFESGLLGRGGGTWVFIDLKVFFWLIRDK